eukprot:3798684-Amphidinium_carterae.1
MDMHRDFDMLEQHNTSSSATEVPRAIAPGSPLTTPAEPDMSCLDTVPGQPAELLVQEAPEPLRPPGKPVARTGFQASLRPYSNGQGVPLTMHPEARPSLQVPA